MKKCPTVIVSICITCCSREPVIYQQDAHCLKGNDDYDGNDNDNYNVNDNNNNVNDRLSNFDDDDDQNRSESSDIRAGESEREMP